MIQVFNSCFEFKQHVAQGQQTSCAMGMFDGVHVGHQLVIQSALRQAKLENLMSVVITFANHPQSVLNHTAPQLLSNLEERLACFEELGADAALVLTFDEALMQLSSEQFVKNTMVDTLNAAFVSVGYDHRFGKNREGDGQVLKAYGQRFGFDVEIVEPVKVQNQIASSTQIRKLLTYGEPQLAAKLLGRNYQLSGPVVSGDHRGQQIGFPTANVALTADRLIPAIGVYAGYAYLLDQDAKQALPAVCNIGHHPTFTESQHLKMEVHIIGFSQDLYQQRLGFEFVEFLRSEEKFASVDALIQQIKEDCQQAQAILK